ncbi:DNA cytosine methyltransferase [Marinisporobacter balticus]|uniref:Cytosine-specific methyltransferase n=1 Tax=Marinisporobacter balticus TaxID=2018667 RepID=A0A4R2KBD0_9FIRM|nr:DNA cytosine methyltransferase [Marinisporobacter balticus]TCO69532.1 DNA (cytosine-5)-methyltransferase 1 [Marinisporobacter balticus]
MKEGEDIIQILELFGGIGAPRKALINLGIPIRSIDYVEIDEKAVRSYNAIFNKDLKYKTQSVVGWNLKPDILIHGSPCQDFSIAGKQKGADLGKRTRSSLMWETINIIKQMGVWKPKFVIWENVKNVLSKHMRHNFNKYLDEMNNMGYTSNFEILNAIDFGLPQKRERVFTVSCLSGTFFNFNILEKQKTPNISELLEDTEEEKYIVTQPSMLKKINIKDGVFGGRVEIIKDFCKTITTKQMRCPNSGVIDLGDGRYRYLTELECWRLQGYSDEDFYNALSVHPGRKGKLNGALYKQAGNSIPIPILESIFKELIQSEIHLKTKCG